MKISFLSMRLRSTLKYSRLAARSRDIFFVYHSALSAISYPCLTSGELYRLLVRWIELNEKEDAE